MLISCAGQVSFPALRAKSVPPIWKLLYDSVYCQMAKVCSVITRDEALQVVRAFHIRWLGLLADRDCGPA